MGLHNKVKMKRIVSVMREMTTYSGVIEVVGGIFKYIILDHIGHSHNKREDTNLRCGIRKDLCSRGTF